MLMKRFLIVGLLSLTALAQEPQLRQPGGYEHQMEYLTPSTIAVRNSKDFWIWDVQRRRLLGHQTGHERTLDMAASPDSRYLVTTDYPCLVRVYSLPGLRLLYTYQPQSPAAQSSYEVHFSSDGRSMVLLGAAHGPTVPDPRVRVVDLASGCEVRSFDFNHSRAHRSEILTGPKRRLARLAHDKLQVWDLKSGAKLKEIRLPQEYRRLHSIDGAIGCGNETYSWETLQQLKSFPKPPTSIDPPPLSPDGKLRFEKVNDKLTVTWVADSKVIYQHEGDRFVQWLSHGFQVDIQDQRKGYNPVFDQKGQKLGVLPDLMVGYPKHRLVTNVVGYGGPMKIFDYERVKEIGSLPFATAPTFSPDGKTLALLTRKGVLLLDVQASLTQGKLVAR